MCQQLLFLWLSCSSSSLHWQRWREDEAPVISPAAAATFGITYVHHSWKHTVLTCRHNQTILSYLIWFISERSEGNDQSNRKASTQQEPASWPLTSLEQDAYTVQTVNNVDISDVDSWYLAAAGWWATSTTDMKPLAVYFPPQTQAVHKQTSSTRWTTHLSQGVQHKIRATLCS